MVAASWVKVIVSPSIRTPETAETTSDSSSGGTSSPSPWAASTPASARVGRSGPGASASTPGSRTPSRAASRAVRASSHEASAGSLAGSFASSAQSYAKNHDNRLGQLWNLLNPALLIGSYYLIFGLLLRTRGNVENYVGFLAQGGIRPSTFREQLRTQIDVVLPTGVGVLHAADRQRWDERT